MSYSFTSHQLQIPLHCTLSHSAFFSNISRGDLPVYEVAASESGSYFMVILEVKDMKAHSVFNTCSQLYPLASLTRLISMGNVYMKTKRKARYWKNITIMFIFWPFFQACLTNLYSFIHVRRGHGGLWYCGIGLFFMRYFGNFNFNMLYCGII